MNPTNDTIEKLTRWLCVQKNYNWDCLSEFSRHQLRLEILKMLHNTPEIKIGENKSE
ncbi:MAG: hypothetical protein WC389_13915 [Lutibacter sp.]|jgi:hypothetical protein